MSPDDVRIRRLVYAVDLVVDDVAVDPLDLRAAERDPEFARAWSARAAALAQLLYALEDMLDRGLGQVAFWRMWEPQFTHLRNHPRFHAIAERSGLLDYWREVAWPDLCQPDNGGFVCD